MSIFVSNWLFKIFVHFRIRNLPSRIFRTIIGEINYSYNKFQIKKNSVSIGTNWKINGKIYIRNFGKVNIGNGFLANSSRLENPIGGDTILRLIVRKKGILQIGNFVGISNSTIVCWTSIVIEDFVSIGGSCKIWDTDFHCIDPDERKANDERNIKTRPIWIKNNAFIGGNSIILKGVTIGENSIIGAGSVIANDIPPNQIWAGNPAKFIRNI